MIEFPENSKVTVEEYEWNAKNQTLKRDNSYKTYLMKWSTDLNCTYYQTTKFNTESNKTTKDKIEV
jgi:hypothetical protein